MDKSSKQCEAGKYGAGCKEKCSINCAGDGDLCHHVTGHCSHGCDAGYTWNKCTRKCPSGSYGIRCSRRCNVRCAGSRNACHHVDGTCDEGCDVGYSGPKCEQKCPIGYYGEGCKEACSEHCAGDRNACDHISGGCDKGCDPGYRGLICIQELIAGVFEPAFYEGAEGSQRKWVKTFVEEEEGWWGKSYVQKLGQLGVDPDIANVLENFRAARTLTSQVLVNFMSSIPKDVQDQVCRLTKTYMVKSLEYNEGELEGPSYSCRGERFESRGDRDRFKSDERQDAPETLGQKVV
ncbi:multiple epidermal growth factor-like domains 10 [Elysia marginata]|uniref:Multiple epidermal growth factor-like domains 10 n=1 Tax=Elysia marginata TaxID=1093978 RepID=A0AAV4JWX3_9GAST|nr:multiple epidermal growth factor-like domains 10 [Elysia marginata]